MDIDNGMIRWSYLALLKKEFGITIKPWDRERLILAKGCIEIYENLAAFYQATGWERDNPQEAGLDYLKEHRLCRMIGGKLWYFSWLRYEEGLKALETSENI